MHPSHYDLFLEGTKIVDTMFNRLLYSLVTLVVLAVLLLLGCSSTNLAGGSAGETGNPVVIGMIVDSRGAPVKGAAVWALPEQFNPILGDTARTISRDTTDARGTYRLILNASGNFSVHAVEMLSGTRLLLPRIAVGSDTTIVPTQTLLSPGTLKVFLPESAQAICGYVYIPGTLLFAQTNTTEGFVIVDSIPAGIISSINFITSGSKIVSIIRYMVTVAPAETAVVFLPAWKYSSHLVLNTSDSGAGVAGTVLNFPVLIRLTSSNFNFNQARNNGGDLRFTSSNSAQLAFEVERWDSVAQHAEIWVKVDTIFGNNDSQYICMFWGNAYASTVSDGSLVFDTATGFAGVWHLNDTCLDATRNRNDGIDYGTSSASGIIGNARDYNGTNAYIEINGAAISSLDFPLSSFSFSFWAWIPDKVSTFNMVWSKGGTSLSYPGYCIKLQTQPDCNAALSDGTQFVHSGFLTQETAVGKWTFFTTVVDRGAARLKAYANGNPGESIDISTLGSLSNSNPAYLGGNGPGEFFTGILDEFRVMRTIVSEDWIRLSYKNQSTIDNLVSFTK
jgi:hypothetical protein